MRRAGGALALLLGLASPLVAQRTAPVTPTAGLVITRSVRLAPGRYALPAPDSQPLIVIRGSNLTVDLTGVVLEGAPAGTPPDRFGGTAILIDGGRNVTVTGATIRGYKVAIHARDTRRLTLAGHTLGHNWRPRLWSGVEHESLADWLSFHRNEANEWLRYGAAIYLERVVEGEIRDNTARQGMNGLLLTRSSRLRIWNNDFSYLSGVGIGLYRSTRNTVMHNQVDWCVRGYSHGFYARGQDSAALLLFEQSSENVVAYNSMTHGGDGLFLWAGQQTMDTGTGGSNDNLFFMNDFSFAPTNGMEATFSRNRFIANRVEGSTHGLWGGYSWGSEIVGNSFAGNRVGIAIEHGQDNRITGNRFEGDSTAIRLWWNRLEPSDWGYPKHRDTRSRGYGIEGNAFVRNRVALRADSTLDVSLSGNSLDGVMTVYLHNGDTLVAMPQQAPSAPVDPAALMAQVKQQVRPMPGGRDVMASPATRRGRDAIIVDEWGPYDWRSPRLWPVGRPDERPLRLRTLGPAGPWRLVRATGAAVSDSAGAIGDTLVVIPSGTGEDWRIELAAAGASGDTVVAFERFEPAQDWGVRVVAWDSLTDPRGASELAASLLAHPPVFAGTLPRLDWMWYRPQVPGVPPERWALRAESAVTLPTGNFVLRTISDDAVRVWVDGQLAIDRWTPHESVVDETPLSGGRHQVRVEYLQVDGWVELRVEFARR
ncbi:MAG TPA: NosD domain-containing protein [Gemmatimonadales bacterium]|nr:NosD domain-containing protein [Gemmatimonadales bacterium]